VEFIDYLYHTSFELIPSGLTPDQIKDSGWASIDEFIEKNSFEANRETLSIEERLRRAEIDRKSNQ
jgi:hypothetical protein